MKARNRLISAFTVLMWWLRGVRCIHPVKTVVVQG
jgi:hypothetical protein